MHRSRILCALAGLLGSNLLACEPGTAEAKADQTPATPSPAEGDGFPPGPYEDHDARLAKELVEGGALLLDVRSAAEFEAGHIEGAVHITHTEVRERIAEIEKLQGGDRHKPIVLYCRSGRRASLAKEALEAAGFDRVTNLGSLDDWPG